MYDAFKIKTGLFKMNIIKILTKSIEDIKKQLNLKVSKAPDFFKNTPIIVDLNTLNNLDDQFFIQKLEKVLKQHALIPIGYDIKEYKYSGLISKKEIVILNNRNNNYKQDENKKEKSENTFIEKRVRSGQQIVSENGDLIIISDISPGAEIIASGNIYVYRTLRGRVIAGVNGNKKAHIICKKFEPHLVSIAGQYEVFEEKKFKEEDNNGYQIQLQCGKIVVSKF